jgi:hypothetical protein
MNRLLLGALIALALVGVGVLWWQSQARIEAQAPPSPATPAKVRSTDLPHADVAGMQGPTPPEAYQLTREQQRFYRYDQNRDGKITRNEMLSTRTEPLRPGRREPRRHPHPAGIRDDEGEAGQSLGALRLPELGGAHFPSVSR